MNDAFGCCCLWLIVFFEEVEEINSTFHHIFDKKFGLKERRPYSDVSARAYTARAFRSYCLSYDIYDTSIKFAFK